MKINGFMWTLLAASILLILKKLLDFTELAPKISQTELDLEWRKRAQEKLVEYQDKFKLAPIGRWTSAWDYGPWPTDDWEFHPDGTAKSIGVTGHGEYVTFYEWRKHEDYVIQMKTTGWQYPDEEYEPDNEPEEWGTYRYEFIIVERYGPRVVMKGFHAEDYLEYLGDIKEKVEQS